MFFQVFRNRPRLRYDSQSSLLRVVLLIITFALMSWAFWANSERYTTKFSAAGRMQDEIGAFSEAQKQEIIKIIANFRLNSRVKVTVKTADKAFTSQNVINGEVLVGIAPEQKQVVIFMPALWRSAVSEGFILQLRSAIAEPGFEDGSWPAATIQALFLLERRFAELSR